MRLKLSGIYIYWEGKKNIFFKKTRRKRLSGFRLTGKNQG
ncbi:Uncharacterized protein dnl_40440 [Desulfonema limicola]|uniref:Uncharacterized protein n=1 Tax=Desulfonema limicola TaxID=45656 RepID=A0A975GHN7_9BACT|nr:Uncharacterized protein dnl_40440 [Desulfonema limicola]